MRHRTMSDNGIRNIDELREDDGRGMPRGVTVAFVVLGGACIGFAALALGGRSSPPPTAKSDPLGELVSSRAAGAEPPAGARPPVDLSSNDVTFPRILSDQGQPRSPSCSPPAHEHRPPQRWERSHRQQPIGYRWFRYRHKPSSRRAPS
jgi:hypothetical protein